MNTITGPRAALAALAGVGLAVGGYFLWSRSKSNEGQSGPGAGGQDELQEDAPIDERNEEALKRQTKAYSKLALDQMSAALPGLVNSFVEHVKVDYEFPPNQVERLHTMLNYNLTGGKMSRGCFVLNTLRYIARARGFRPSPQMLFKATVLAWCIEILQASFLVADDIMDGSLTRRGQPCWYRRPDVGLDGVNDALILEAFIYFLLHRHFRTDATYATLVDLYHEVSLQTQMGQMMDLTSNPQGERRAREVNLLQTFNLDMYKRIVRFKTAYYSFYLPVASAMILCGMTAERDLNAVKDICVEIGEKFQIQDDWLDCFGDERKTGKKGTDIEDHKCSWLVVQAMRRMTPDQFQTLQRLYGSHDEASVNAVKQLYLTVGLRAVYDEQERDSYARVVRMIDQHTDRIPRAMMMSVLLTVHGREK